MTSQVTLAASVALCVLAVLPDPAYGQDKNAEAIESVTQLNKKALEEYDNLSFDIARRLLNDALEVCAENGLVRHPIRARTLVHLGVVALASGPSAHDEAVKFFRDALATQPDIKLTDRVANPEVQAAFNEAVAAMKDAPPSGAGAAAPAEPVEPAPATLGVSHNAISSGVKGSAIPVSVTTDPALVAKRVVLSYRPEGGSEFIARDLKEYSPGNWSGSIPEIATAGSEVAYAISVENESGEVVGTQGSPAAPMVIKLKAKRGIEVKKPSGDETPEPEPTTPQEKPNWFFGLGVGSGFGYATGKGDVNNTDNVTAGFGAAKLGHLLPEVGYFVGPDLLLSLQIRLQSVSGATSVRDPMAMMCGADHVCDPATGALAAFARMTWLFGESAFVPYLSVSVGAGQIRHLASFPNAVTCGSDAAHPIKCVDTVAAGPILLGPGAGFILNATSNFGFTLGVNTLLGFPQFTFHLDFNAGVVIEL